MKLSVNWLNDFVDVKSIPVEKLVSRLTLSTCEVEEVFPVFGHLDGVVAAKIVERKPHPDADRLSVCRVETGGETLTIVCGAPNAAEGLVVPLATIGTELPTETGSIKIAKSKLRGVDSHGMLCSATELGLSPLTGEIDGLLVLDPKIKPGTPFSKLYPGIQDTILDIDNKSITHRPDLWCHYGFAREIAAIFHKPLKKDPLASKLPKSDPKLPQKKIVIEDGAAKGYFGLSCTGVRVAPAPVWMQVRLMNIGQKPINNIVDASNYVMFELGQPNHTFDAKQLKSDTVTVASAGKGAKSFTTLDGVERTLPDGCVMIFDGKPSASSAVAIGGIMGGMNSGIEETTTELFLESATFPREKIRRALSHLQLRTDSAIRFEKGQDPAKAKPALARLVELLGESSPEMKVGAPSGESVEGAKQNKISVSLSFLHERVGFAIKEKDVTATLERLHFTVKTSPSKKQPADGNPDVTFQITAPTFRSQYDITIPEDIVEELGRIHGYDNIEPVAPQSPIESLPLHTRRAFERRVRAHAVLAGGFNETYNYSFASQSDNQLFYNDGLKLKNPIHADADRLRISLIPGLLRQGHLNQDRFETVKLFEYGRIYYKDPKKKPTEIATEEYRLAFLTIPPHEKGDDADGGAIFREFLKFRSGFERMVIDLFGERGLLRSITDAGEDLHTTRFLHPGCGVEFVTQDGVRLGVAGILNPFFAQQFEMKRPALIAEFYFDCLYTHFEATRKTVRYTTPSIFPDSTFELSIVMDETDSTALPVELIESLAFPELRAIRLLSIYRGPPLPDRKKSASYEIRCGMDQGTLTGERLQEILEGSIQILAKNGLSLR